MFVGLVLSATHIEAQQSRVFVSSASSDGNLGGLAGADMSCNALATTAAPVGQDIDLDDGIAPLTLSTRQRDCHNDVESHPAANGDPLMTDNDRILDRNWLPGLTLHTEHF